MNSLFRDIFKEADHYLINELAEILIVKNVNDVKEGKISIDNFVKD